MKPYYQDEACTIYHGDCREILPTLKPVDLVLTDPPYGVTQNKWDDRSVAFDFFDMIETPLVCTAQNPFSAQMICRYSNRFKWSDVWEKSQAVGFLNAKIMPLRQHEDILVFSNGKAKYFPKLTEKPAQDIRPNTGRTAVNNNYGKCGSNSDRDISKSYPRSVVRFKNSQERNHPTEKPIKLFSYLLEIYTELNDSILDPFMGSGTTLRAAKDLGRKAIGIELEEKYCEIAVERLRQEVLL